MSDINQASSSKRISHLQADSSSKIQRVPEFYNKNGLAHTLHGNIYQLKLLMLFLKRGLNLGYTFQLATEWDEAEKLDDLVFRYDTSQGPFVCFLQAKHKQDQDKRIKRSHLLEECDGEYSLLKYFISFRKIKLNKRFENTTIEDLVIATNIDLDDALKSSFDVISTQDKILGSPRCYKFKTGGLLAMEDIKSTLQNASELHVLARKLKKCIMEGKPINFKEDMFRRYQIPLRTSVIDCSVTKTNIVNATFYESFINDTNSDVAVKAFRSLFKNEFDKKKPSRSSIPTIKVSTNFADLRPNFHVTKESPNKFPCDPIGQHEIDEFLNKLRIVVTPNEKDLSEMIKKELGDEFNQIDKKAVYSRFLEMMLDWFKEKKGTFLTNKDGAQFFEGIREEILGPIWFDVHRPIELFTGRSKVLEKLHEKVLRNKKGTVISQMTFLSGLGGIGKSELAKKYAEIHADKFDFNVVWINAESEIALENSFRKLAELPKINISSVTVNEQRKSIEAIVHEIYTFFSRRKVLFIFDNAENCEYFHNFLPLGFASPIAESQKPYTLITSREKYWDAEIEVVELLEMELEDAVELIKRGLKNTKTTEEDVTNLALTLQCFPLAMHQAIAYIKNKQSRKRYEIKEYLDDFKVQTSILLDHPFKGIVNNYTKTTFTTWLMTIEKMKRSRQPGNLAVEIFNIIAYLSPELIKKSIFASLGDSHLVDPAIDMLINHCMINCDVNPNIIRVHRLVQEVTRLNLQRCDQEVFMIRNALTLMNNLEVKLGSDHYRHIWKYAAKYQELVEEFYSKPCSYDEYSPLHLLSSNNENNEIIEDMLRCLKRSESLNFMKLLNSKDVKERTPMHIVAESNNIEMLKSLINHGAEFDNSDSSGLTPLALAASKGNVKVLEYLILKGASSEVIDNAGNNPARLAAYAGHVKAVDFLLKDSDSLKNYQLQAMINSAAKQDKLNDLRDFLNNLKSDNENDVLASRIGFWSPIELMVKNGYDTSFIEIMINNVAVLERSDIDKITYLAAINGHLQILEFLESKGYANIGQNIEGYTSLHASSMNGNLEIVKYFVEKRKIDVNITDEKKETPLHSAAFHGRKDIVQLLLENGADIYATNRWGFTPIIYAAFAGKFDIVEFLLHRDFDPKKKSIIGRTLTLLNIVAMHDAVDVARTLIEEKMIDIDVRADNSLTPLHVAAFFNSKKTINYLIEKSANIESQANVFQAIELLGKDKAVFKAMPWLKKFHTVIEKFDTNNNMFLSNNMLLKAVKNSVKVTPADISHALGYKNKLNKNKTISSLASSIKSLLPPKEVEFLKVCIEERDNERFDKSEIFSYFDFYGPYLYGE